MNTAHTGQSPDNKLLARLMIITGLLGVLYFLFGLSLGWGIYFGSTVILGVGMLFIVSGLLRSSGRWDVLSRKFKRTKVFVSIVTMIITASFLIVEGLIVHSAVITDSSKADYLVILGAHLLGEEPALELRKRLDKGIEYIKENPHVKVVVSGGQGSDEAISEAEAMKRYLIKHGVEDKKILLEDKSTSTYENLKFSRDLIRKTDQVENPKLAIVTNDFHLYRTRLLAARLGCDARGIPAETPLYIIPNHYVREYFAVIKSLLLDAES